MNCRTLEVGYPLKQCFKKFVQESERESMLPRERCWPQGLSSCSQQRSFQDRPRYSHPSNTRFTILVFYLISAVHIIIRIVVALQVHDLILF